MTITQDKNLNRRKINPCCQPANCHATLAGVRKDKCISHGQAKQLMNLYGKRHYT